MIIYGEILKEFQKKRVKYIIVGGIAFNLLGGERATSDLDILVKMSNLNLAKIVTILKKRGYRVKQPVDPMGIANKTIREDWIHNKNMKAFNFYKEDEFKEVDIIIETPVSFDTAKKTVQHIKLAEITVPVISIKNLIKMKQEAKRPVDQVDIAELQEIAKHKKNKRYV